MASKIFEIRGPFLFLGAAPAGANPETVAGISDQLICRCSCPLANDRIEEGDREYGRQPENELREFTGGGF